MLGVFLYIPYIALILDFKSAMRPRKAKKCLKEKRNQTKAVDA
jgi:hypothetical protein